MDDVQLANWFAGHDRTSVEVYRVFDPTLFTALGVNCGAVVWLSDYTLNKTKYSHPEVDFRDYQRMPEILSNGFVSPGNKKSSLEVLHVDLGTQPFRFWRVCLKGTTNDEAFVTMFHRSHLKDARRLYRRSHKRGTVLRDHKSEPVRRLLGRTGTAA